MKINEFSILTVSALTVHLLHFPVLAEQLAASTSSSSYYYEDSTFDESEYSSSSSFASSSSYEESSYSSSSSFVDSFFSSSSSFVDEINTSLCEGGGETEGLCFFKAYRALGYSEFEIKQENFFGKVEGFVSCEESADLLHRWLIYGPNRPESTWEFGKGNTYTLTDLTYSIEGNITDLTCRYRDDEFLVVAGPSSLCGSEDCVVSAVHNGNCGTNEVEKEFASFDLDFLWEFGRPKKIASLTWEAGKVEGSLCEDLFTRISTEASNQAAVLVERAKDRLCNHLDNKPSGSTKITANYHCSAQ